MDVSYSCEGVNMVGTIYRGNETAVRGAILIFPEIPGPGTNVHQRAENIAQAGFVAMVADLHGGGVVLQDPGEIKAKLDYLRADRPTIRLRARAAYSALKRELPTEANRVAAIGYCFGGTMALELGRDGAPLSAVVGFHCGLSGSDLRSRLACPVLVCIGADDPSVPAEQRLAFELEMREAQIDWTMQIYGNTVHSFTDRNAASLGRPEFARYNASADAQAWDAMMRLFERTLG
jgi:dienelactone hydrolase